MCSRPRRPQRGRIFFGIRQRLLFANLPVRARSSRGRLGIMLDKRPSFFRMPPTRDACHDTDEPAALVALNNGDLKVGGRRLEGSTVDDFGRGLDVPPAFESPGGDLPAGGIRAVQCVGTVVSHQGDGPWHDALSRAVRMKDSHGSILPMRAICSARCRA